MAQLIAVYERKLSNHQRARTRTVGTARRQVSWDLEILIKISISSGLISEKHTISMIFRYVQQYPSEITAFEKDFIIKRFQAVYHTKGCILETFTLIESTLADEPGAWKQVQSRDCGVADAEFF